MFNNEKPSSYFVFVGTYASEESEGIHLLRFDAEEGRLHRLGGAAGVVNPSFLALDAARSRLFAVSETKEGAVVSYRYELETGRVTEINRQPTLGASPCHLQVDDTGKWLFVVNYRGGSLCLFPIAEDGTIGEMADSVQHQGNSVRTDRQDGPHPHSVIQIPQTNFWLVPDLGTDRLYIYKHDPLKGKLYRHGEVQTDAGSGPRHATTDQERNLLYVIEELSSTITGYRYDVENGSFTRIDSIGTLPEFFSGANICADIHMDPSRNVLYGSNRGHDSIAVFRILEDGKLEALDHTSTLGKAPRNFALVAGEPYMLVANQETDSIVVFELSDTGVPVPNGQSFNITKPVCVKVL